MKLINKLKEKDNLPIVLFFLLFINLLPLFIGNIFTKESTGVKTIVAIVCFIIEITTLIYIYVKNIKSIKVNKKNIIYLLILIAIMGIVQIKNFLINDFKFFDIFNIGCIFINLVLFYIVLYDFKIDEKNIKFFLKGICWISIAAIIWNLVLFNKEILAQLGIVDKSFSYSYANNIKSFFANRNSLAFFIYLAIISTTILMRLDSKNTKKYIGLIILFIFGIWCTHSKTGFVVAITYIELCILLNSKYNIKKRLLICTVVGIASIIVFLNILGRFPSTNKVSQIYISDKRIERLSGRNEIWRAGFEFLNKSPFNYIFGVGRFNSLELLKFESKSYSQFHNLYLDIVLTGGILQLIYVFSIFIFIVRKILKSDLEINFKKIYISMYITYAIYIIFESCGRFSMGWSDTLCIMFFIAIPLLHANSKKS